MDIMTILRPAPCGCVIVRQRRVETRIAADAELILSDGKSV